jgi:hypothetical protein
VSGTTRRANVLVLAVMLCVEALVLAQTEIKPPKNKFTPAQDVEYGEKAAAEIRRQYPIITDEQINSYLTMLGNRLVAVAPPDLNKPEFKYSFTPVNVKEINAFALPGGPMFVHRGMFDAAANEGEVVGVMAHELSHVLLRHGTANATKAENPWLQLGQIAGAVGGAMVGGVAGSAISQTSDFGLGTLLLRYSRDYEKQADLLGSQLMAKAGYDPRDLAHMFETIQSESQGGAPQWLSSHPDPGNRTAYITKEAEALTIATPPDMSQFPTIKERFASLPKAKSVSELSERGASPAGSANAPSAVGTPGQPIPAPSSQFRTFSAGNLFQASVPANWTTIPSKSEVKVVPQNGYGELNGRTVFTHGVEFGIAKASSRDLQEATKSFLLAIAQNNPQLRLAGDQQYGKLADRSALLTPLTNPSSLGGSERITIATAFLVDGNLFYYLTVAPEADVDALLPVFRKIGQSIRLMDVK